MRRYVGSQCLASVAVARLSDAKTDYKINPIYWLAACKTLVRKYLDSDSLEASGKPHSPPLHAPFGESDQRIRFKAEAKQLPHQFAAARSPPHALLLRNAIGDGSARCPALAPTRAALEALDRRP